MIVGILLALCEAIGIAGSVFVSEAMMKNRTVMLPMWCNGIMGFFVLLPLWSVSAVNGMQVTHISQYDLTDCFLLTYVSIADVFSISLFTVAFKYERGERLLGGLGRAQLIYHQLRHSIPNVDRC